MRNSLRRRTSQAKGSGAQLSQASELDDEVLDLDDPCTKIDKNTGMMRRKSNISAHSLVSDYDLGSIMDINLEQQSKKEVNK